MNKNMKKTAYIKLFAGLGNQLFQYAYGQYLLQQGYAVRYILNRSSSDLLSVFTLTEQDGSTVFAPEGKFKNTFLFLIKCYARFITHNYHTGFYQDVRYPAQVFSLNLRFTRETEYSKTEEYKNIRSSTAVSVHIRGGDYVHEKQYSGICTADYYRKAAEYITQTAGVCRFFIFTNDTKYAQQMLEPLCHGILQHAVFINNSDFHQDPGFDLFLMKSCTHHIIANSTFSWWGAFLNNNPDKIVIAPKNWTNSEDESTINICADNWIRS